MDEEEEDRVLDELEIEHWEQVILHEHELEELFGHEHRVYELEVDKYEEIHVVEEELEQEFELEDLEQQECFEELEDLEHELDEELS